MLRRWLSRLTALTATLLIASTWGCSKSNSKNPVAPLTPAPGPAFAWTFEGGSGLTDSLRVWGLSGNNAFAVGGRGTILHYDGSAWSPMTSGTSQVLRTAWGSSGSDVFAVGAAGTILHYNGSAWSPMASRTT